MRYEANRRSRYCNSKPFSDITVWYEEQGKWTFHGHGLATTKQQVSLVQSGLHQPIPGASIKRRSRVMRSRLTSQESETKMITMHSDDPEVVEAMSHYIYDIDRGWPRSEDSDTLENVLLSLKLFQVADKYDCSSVKSITETRFKRRMGSYMSMTAKSKMPERKGFGDTD